ncbi:hypothetical protein PNOK_0353400 [Pyrrhoderma noxium]|uniref:Uncharacterized protein n=1 Tax=Pyrrhoderma noxium TaxID=2282107 RepID=A0A286UMS5_9AGAM|nr:hypothetical protein PNOK_0353400 [Pyrrhoderma noxium]
MPGTVGAGYGSWRNIGFLSSGNSVWAYISFLVSFVFVIIHRPQSLPASPSSPPSNVIHTNNGLLSPPHNTFRAAPSTRRSKKPRRKAQSESDETATETSDEEELEIRITSYTNSFRPFSYPSTPKLVTVSTTSQGNLPRPPPPLFRPKTFWRHTRRSALTGPSYSPSSYLVRRSTFIAAGLSLDKPHADLSALGAELRIGTINLVPSTALPL